MNTWWKASSIVNQDAKKVKHERQASLGRYQGVDDEDHAQHAERQQEPSSHGAILAPIRGVAAI